MGCACSTPAASDAVEPKAVDVTIADNPPAAAGTLRTAASRGDSADTIVDGSPRRSDAGSVPANKWSLMESAEEKGFLKDESDAGEGLDALLQQQFPQLHTSRSRFAQADTWRFLTNEVPMGEGDFVLKPPWTLEQAHAFYFHLCQTDERRRNARRPDDAPAIPKRSVYEVLTAAYEMYDRRAREEGALQIVPPPANANEKLKVCGDTHGQLQVRAAAPPQNAPRLLLLPPSAADVARARRGGAAAGRAVDLR